MNSFIKILHSLNRCSSAFDVLMLLNSASKRIANQFSVHDSPNRTMVCTQVLRVF